MSGAVSRDIVQKWQNAVEAVEDGRLREAASLFWEIRDFSAKIWFNLSTVDVLQGDLAAANEKLKECLQRDGYLAVAHFQRGVIMCRLGRLTEGKELFSQVHKTMRTRDSIDYKQLGLNLRLTSQQIRHNQTIIDKYLMTNRQTAQIPEVELEMLPVSLFRPARSLVDNLEKKVFLKSAKLISAVPDIVQTKGNDLVSRPPSSSAPSSPSAHRKLEPKPRTQPALTPPPSRPPPRLPPTAVPSSVSGTHHRDNSSGQGSGSKQGDQRNAMVPKGQVPGRVGPSLSQGSAALEGCLRNGRMSQGPARGTSYAREEDRTVSHCGSGVGSSGSRSIQSPESTSNLSDDLEQEPQCSVGDRIKELEKSRSCQGHSNGSVRLTAEGNCHFSGQGVGVKGKKSWPESGALTADGNCHFSGQGVGVKGKTSWPESGAKAAERSKPPRPPPPKFVS